jgi:hypothetical protein
MKSPARLYLSLDTHSISEAFTAITAAEAVILPALGIASRLIHADQGEPTGPEWGYATMQRADPNAFGFPPTGRALGGLRLPSNSAARPTGAPGAAPILQAASPVAT